jgi:glutaredoxin 3
LNTQEKKLEALLKKAIIYKSMKNVTVYMGPMCAFCDAAKRLLVRNNIPYKEINIALEEDKMDEMLSKSNGKRTIPQIFFDDLHVGGYEELRALENKGELDNLIK